MAENSDISWCDHTFNPWIGCTKVGPGCDHCYAEKLATTRLKVGWGKGAPRRRTKPQNWSKLLKWDREADAFYAANGRWPRVFCASLADIFDNEIDSGWRSDFFDHIRKTRNMEILIVTKRISNVERMLPRDFGEHDADRRVILIITVVNQPEADRDVPRLLKLKHKFPWLRVGLSIEPMLGPIHLYPYWLDRNFDGRQQRGLGPTPTIDWVITGGESKQLDGIRPLVELETQWVRDIDRVCVRYRVPHHFKQWGYTIPADQLLHTTAADDAVIYRDKRGAPRLIWREEFGNALYGHEVRQFPEQRIAA